MADDDNSIQKTCYEQNFEQARNLNQQMNQVPILAMTLTGGLWFGAGVTETLDMRVRFVLLVFAGACNLALALAILRIRDVLQSYLEKIEEFYPAGFVTGHPKTPAMAWLSGYSMVTIYCALMLSAALASWYGAFFLYWPYEFCRWFGVASLVIALLALYLGLVRRSGRQQPQHH